MNERECLKAIALILKRFNEVDRLGDASRSDSEASSEVVDASDPTSGVVARPEGLGDSDDLRRGKSAIKAFISRTRPPARRATRSRGR